MNQQQLLDEMQKRKNDGTLVVAQFCREFGISLYKATKLKESLGESSKTDIDYATYNTIRNMKLALDEKDSIIKTLKMTIRELSINPL